MSKLEVFSHGLFQDILTLMSVLKKDTIKKTEIKGYLKEKLAGLDLPPIKKKEEKKREKKKGCTPCEKRKRKNAEAEAAFIFFKEKAKKRKEAKLNERV